MIAYGHATIIVDGRKTTLIPSLKNIEKIGTPKEIVDVFKFLSVGINDKLSFVKSMRVLGCCVEKEETSLDDIFGGLATSYHGDRVVYTQGMQAPETARVIAMHMLRHGICGVCKETDKSDAKPIEEFKAVDYITMARRLFDISLEEAKNLTMTEILIMAEQINKESRRNGKAPPDKKEHKETMSWLERVNAKRKANNG